MIQRRLSRDRRGGTRCRYGAGRRGPLADRPHRLGL